MTATLPDRTIVDADEVPFSPTILGMARRNLTRLVRLPSILVPMVVMPMFFIVAFTGSFDGISRVEGYPTDKIVNWVAAFAMLQGASFAGVGTAGSMANDLETGFIDRLLVSPIRRSAILVAPLVYTFVRALVPLVAVLIVALFQGIDIPGGVAGIAMAFVGGVGGALLFGSFALAVVLRIGDVKAMAIVQMVSFGLMFPSIGQVPMALLSGWMHFVARVNPITNLLRLTRQGFLGPVTWDQTWPGLVVLGIGIPLLLVWASKELAGRTP